MKTLPLPPTVYGSSPLARGTPSRRSGRHSSTRLIPARAGNTTGQCERRCGSSAHPRSRGEHKTAFSPPESFAGSSPLARGTPVAGDHGECTPRLIPARAGNTNACKQGVAAASAHPRSRGEHSKFPLNRPPDCGSSPLARGTQFPAESYPRGFRLIPARAGNTPSSLRRSGPCAAHPRSRGEHRSVKAIASILYGSSPLARGTLRQRSRRRITQRLIPARAGNTRALADTSGSISAHSPLARGTHNRLGKKYLA